MARRVGGTWRYGIPRAGSQFLEHMVTTSTHVLVMTSGHDTNAVNTNHISSSPL